MPEGAASRSGQRRPRPPGQNFLLRWIVIPFELTAKAFQFVLDGHYHDINGNLHALRIGKTEFRGSSLDAGCTE